MKMETPTNNTVHCLRTYRSVVWNTNVISDSFKAIKVFNLFITFIKYYLLTLWCYNILKISLTRISLISKKRIQYNILLNKLKIKVYTAICWEQRNLSIKFNKSSIGSTSKWKSVYCWNDFATTHTSSLAAQLIRNEAEIRIPDMYE